jgi:hypothetical protein
MRECSQVHPELGARDDRSVQACGNSPGSSVGTPDVWARPRATMTAHSWCQLGREAQVLRRFKGFGASAITYCERCMSACGAACRRATRREESRDAALRKRYDNRLHQSAWSARRLARELGGVGHRDRPGVEPLLRAPPRSGMNRSTWVSQREGRCRNGCRAVGRLSIDGKLEEPCAACRSDVAEVDPCLCVCAYLVAAVDPGGSSRGLGIHEPSLDRSARPVARLPVREPDDDCDSADQCKGCRQQPADDASSDWCGS